MAENSKIEWTHHTFNPWRGCTKIAAGCANCYAEAQAKRNPGTLGIWGDNGTRVLASEAMWKEPLKWDRLAASAGERHRVFCASMADVFEDWPGQLQQSNGGWAVHNRNFGMEVDYGSVPLKGGNDAVYLDAVRRRLFAIIDSTPHLDWLLLTKRPGNIRRMWPAFTFMPQTKRVEYDLTFLYLEGNVPTSLDRFPRRENVWLGTSVAVQEDADKNIPELLKCRDLAPVLFLSCEPLLGPVDLHFVRLSGKDANEAGEYLDAITGDTDGCFNFGGGIDWVIVGGESGHHARPMHPDWARSLRDQCQAAGVPFFFKQWGEFTTAEQLDEGAFSSWEHHATSGMLETDVMRFGKRLAGRLLDGREWNEFPSPASDPRSPA